MVVVGVFAHFDVHAVGVEVVRFEGLGAGDCYFGGIFGVGVVGGFGAGVGCDVDFGSDDALEGIFVEGVEEALELVPVFPDFAEGHHVDYQCEDEGDPVLTYD